jgi:sterol O-acyltransferase
MYGAFYAWACLPGVSALDNWFWFLLYVGYIVGLAVYPVFYVAQCDLPIASSLIVVFEQVRLMMKVHAFVRENVPRVLDYNRKINAGSCNRNANSITHAADLVPELAIHKCDTPQDECDAQDDDCGAGTVEVDGVTGNPAGRVEMNAYQPSEEFSRNRAEGTEEELDLVTVDLEENPCPEFGKFLYFLFAPTLIYRDEYPRREKINWGYVASNLFQVVASMFYCNFLISHFLIPLFQNFATHHVSLRTFITSIFACVLPGTLVLLLAFFAFLHSWLNAFAEMLCFADRQFYKDWWNSTSFSGYYRTWNVVVHDWLYAYVYTDIMKITKGSDMQRRASSAVSVFLLSALVHEYIIGIALRFFYPIMFIEFFGFGVLMFFVTGRSGRGWNVFIWFGLLVGTGLMMSLYSLEYFARKNCAPTYDNFLDWLIPRSWICVPKV